MTEAAMFSNWAIPLGCFFFLFMLLLWGIAARASLNLNLAGSRVPPGTCAIMVDTCNRNKGGGEGAIITFSFGSTISFVCMCVWGFVGLEEQHVVSSRCMCFVVLSMDV